MSRKVSTAAPAITAERHYFFFFFAAFLAGAFLAAFFAALAILDRPSVLIVDRRVRLSTRLESSHFDIDKLQDNAQTKFDVW
jgi:hypothetical protein